MNINDPSRFAIMLGTGQWQRCAFENAALVDGIVQLGWENQSESGDPQAVQDSAGAGLAFDAHCRLYHSVPDEHRVERLLWDVYEPARPQRAPPIADLMSEDVLEHPAPDDGFAPVGPPLASFTPRALACDEQDHLYVLDTHSNQVRIVDIQQRRILRSQAVPAGAVDIAWHEGWLYGLSSAPNRLWRLSATHGLQDVAAPVDSLVEPARLTFARDGRLFILQRAHENDAAIAELGRPGDWLAAPRFPDLGAGDPVAFASDIFCICHGDDDYLVVARRSEEDFLRIDIAAAPYSLAEPLTARHYDGMGIAATPDGRVVFWTPKGARHATSARLRYQSPGRVIGFRLDSGQYQTVWGRVLLDACLPANTALRVHCIISDEEDEAARVLRTPPLFSALADIAEEEESPLPLLAHMPGDEEAGQLIFKRLDGTEQAWLLEEEVFETFETPAPATPGRYLWLVFDLIGHSRATPKLRSVRAECPGHDWLRRLPQLYSRNDAMRGFLQRYLAPLAGLENDLVAQSTDRHALLKPLSTSAAVLPWLANWIGLTLDERWTEKAKRKFIHEAAWLFRLRGTVWAVKRMLEIVADAPIVLIENFRLRGVGRIGDGADSSGNGWDEPAVLGMGFRVGGPVGAESVTGEEEEIEDSFSLHAHRFTVMVQRELNSEMEAVLRHLLDVHRPAHTLFTLCSVGAGMRIGRGLQIEISSILGKSGGFSTLQLGAGTLGRGQVLGRPVQGLRPGTARVGSSARIG